jgi:hypothetical protein
MLIADVGQGAWEEINYEPAGASGRNYGWRFREGAHPYTGSTTIPLVDPIYDYDRAAGRSVTGGYVYRGVALPSMRGRYFFADYVTRRVWSLAIRLNGAGEALASVAADLVDHTDTLGGTNVIGGVSGFGVDAAGELYIINHSAGIILKIVGAPAAPTNVRITR